MKTGVKEQKRGPDASLRTLQVTVRPSVQKQPYRKENWRKYPCSGIKTSQKNKQNKAFSGRGHYVVVVSQPFAKASHPKARASKERGV